MAEHELDLGSMLTWSASREAELQATQQRYLERTSAGLSALLTDASCRAQLRSLPPASLVRILSAPELCNYLINAGQGLTWSTHEFIARSVAVERARIGEAIAWPAEPGPLWSAIGDVALIREAGAWRLLPVATAIAPGLPLDVCSPFALRTSSDIPYGPAQERRLADKLRHTWASLRTLSPHAAHFVASATVVICGRPDDALPFHFTSASSRATIGKLVLVNAHLEAVGVDVLINALIHEAIHSWLYKHELERPFVPELELGWRRQVVSPWTGTSLRLVTFIHACYVYWGLSNFWLSERVSEGFSAEVIAKHRAFLREGYGRSQATLASLDCEPIQAGVLDELRRLTAHAHAALCKVDR